MGEVITHRTVHLVPVGVPLTHEWHPAPPHGVIWDFYGACGWGQEVGVGLWCVYVCVRVCAVGEKY